MNENPNPTVLLEILHQRKRVAKAEAADLAVTLKINFDALVEKKFDFSTDDLWEKVGKIAAEAAAEVEKTVADRCEALGLPREFAPGVTGMGWHGPSVLNAKKAELSRLARTVIEARLKATARAIEKHTLAAMQRIIAPGMTARDAQAVIDDALSLTDLMQPVTYEEVEALRGVSSRSLQRSARPWRDTDRAEARMLASSFEDSEDTDAEALRDEFRRLLD